MAADDEQVALPRAHRSAGDGGVDEAQAGLGEAGGHGPDAGAADGGGQQDDGAARHVRGDAALAEEELLELGLVAHGDEDDVGAGDGLGGRRGRGHARSLGEGEALGGDVEAANGEALRQVRGHGQPHGPQAEDGDGRGGRRGCGSICGCGCHSDLL